MGKGGLKYLKKNACVVNEWPLRNRQVRERCHEALQAMDLAFSLNESESAQTNFYHEKEQDQFLESFKVNYCILLFYLVLFT